MKKKKIYELIKNSNWKNLNKEYLFELQKFLDLADNIDNEKLRQEIINQMLKCDKCLTNIAEKILKKYLNNN